MENDLLLTVASWGAAVAGLAAGVKGAGYLVRSGRFGFGQIRRAGRAIGKLAAIGDEESWPNGSTDLPTFLDWVHQSLKKLLAYHREDLAAWEAGLNDRRDRGSDR